MTIFGSLFKRRATTRTKFVVCSSMHVSFHAQEKTLDLSMVSSLSLRTSQTLCPLLFATFPHLTTNFYSIPQEKALYALNSNLQSSELAYSRRCAVSRLQESLLELPWRIDDACQYC